MLVRFGNVDRHRARAERSRATKSIGARSFCASPSSVSALTSVPVRLHREVTVELPISVLRRRRSRGQCRSVAGRGVKRSREPEDCLSRSTARKAKLNPERVRRLAKWQWTCGLCHFFLAQEPCFHDKILLNITPNFGRLEAGLASGKTEFERVDLIRRADPSGERLMRKLPPYLRRGNIFRRIQCRRKPRTKSSTAQCIVYAGCRTYSDEGIDQASDFAQSRSRNTVLSHIAS